VAPREVLIVEHDPNIRLLFRELFLRAGYTCLLAGNGGEGLEVFRGSRPALIVTELNMPVMRGGERVAGAGIELLQQVRQEDPDATVIVVGGMDVKNHIVSLKLGAYAHLRKPVNMDELLIVVERALERRQLLIERREYRERLEEIRRKSVERSGLHNDAVPTMAQREVLIVEHDRQAREALHQIFVSAGYHCLLANDGREGVEAFKAGRPPLVVTDLKMPGITGIELLQQVRAVDDDVAVIVLTGAADVKTAIASLKLGAHDVIMKPVNMDELLIATERALERRQLLIERREYHERLEEIRRKSA